MGPVVGNSSWSELEEGWSFTVPTTADGDFVSPAFAGAVEGGDKVLVSANLVPIDSEKLYGAAAGNTQTQTKTKKGDED